MSYKINPTKQFKKDFDKLDNSVKEQIKKKVEEVAIDPTRHKHLRHSLSGYSRVRVGKWRIVFDYNIQLKELYLRKVVAKHDY